MKATDFLAFPIIGTFSPSHNSAQLNLSLPLRMKKGKNRGNMEMMKKREIEENNDNREDEKSIYFSV